MLWNKYNNAPLSIAQEWAAFFFSCTIAGSCPKVSLCVTELEPPAAAYVTSHSRTNSVGRWNTRPGLFALLFTPRRFVCAAKTAVGDL